MGGYQIHLSKGNVYVKQEAMLVSHLFAVVIDLFCMSLVGMRLQNKGLGVHKEFSDLDKHERELLSTKAIFFDLFHFKRDGEQWAWTPLGTTHLYGIATFLTERWNTALSIPQHCIHTNIQNKIRPTFSLNIEV